MTVNATALQLSTTSGFMQYYYNELKNHTTYKAAYEATEEEFVKHFKRTRYKNYGSFRNALCNFNKK